MFLSISSIDDVISSILPSDAKIKDRIERSENEVDLEVETENEIKKLKLFNLSEVKKDEVMKFVEIHSLLSDINLCFIYPSTIYQIPNIGGYFMIYERSYYSCDLKSIIYTKCLSLSEISSLIRLSEILMMLSECDIVVSNIKSNNIIYENNEVKLVDLCLNELRRSEDMVIEEICYRSPEELSGGESNDKSVIWSVGCILYEMLNKELPFKEENDIFKTLNNILKGKCSVNLDDNEMMKDILNRMLKVKNEDRMSLIEFKKEMMKDPEDNMMIIEERKEIIFNNDYSIEISPFVDVQADYYINHNKYDIIRNDLMKLYNMKYNERFLSVLLMMQLHKRDECIRYYVKYQIVHHQYEYERRCYLDEKDDYVKEEIIRIDSNCLCLCEEGMSFLFKILKIMNKSKLQFYEINLSSQNESFFGLLFYQLSKLEELYFTECNLNSHFLESFIKSIPFMKKLKYVDFSSNRIGPTGFKLLLPYLQLLINKDNKLNLKDMNLDDESMKLLSSELHKYPNIEKIDIRQNNNIHSSGLYSLFSIYSISKIWFDYNGSKELLVDKDIPELIKYIKNDKNELDLNHSEIDDDFFKSFILLRLDELEEIEKLNLSNNNLTSESVEILINNLSSLPNLRHVELYGNGIGDVGMKILCPHLEMLKYRCTWNYTINCSKMELSLEGLKYLLNSLKSINEEIKLDISENNIDSCGIDYLNNYMKENDNIEKLFIHNNPIGNAGLKVLLNNLDMLINDDCEMNLSNISIDDESLKLLCGKIDSIRGCKTINLTGNNIKMSGLKSICEKSLKREAYPFIEMRSECNDEVEKYMARYRYIKCEWSDELPLIGKLTMIMCIIDLLFAFYIHITKQYS